MVLRSESGTHRKRLEKTPEQQCSRVNRKDATHDRIRDNGPPYQSETIQITKLPKPGTMLSQYSGLNIPLEISSRPRLRALVVNFVIFSFV